MEGMEATPAHRPILPYRGQGYAPPGRPVRTPYPEWVWGVLGAVLLGVLGAALLWVPGVLAQDFLIANRMQLEVAGMPILTEVERRWLDQAPPPRPGPGSEEAVACYLARNPWVTGVLEVRTGRVRVRQGQALVTAADDAPVRGWFQAALSRGQSLYFPAPAGAKEPCVILMGPRWGILKQWRTGSPETAQALAAVPGLAEGRTLRLLDPEHPSPRLGEAGLPSSPFELGAGDSLRRMVILYTSGEFLDRPVTFELSPLPREAQRLVLQRRLILWSARLALIALLLGAWQWLAMKGRERRALKHEAERLAATAHGLRTPLAILKFRADLLRLQRLEGEAMVEQLLRLGSEVDQITEFMDRSLEPLQPTQTLDLGPPWLLAMAEDYRAFLSLEHRELEAQVAPRSARVREVPFRTCLQLVLDNAIVHGVGTVQLRTTPGRDRLRVTIHDGGPALDASRLEALGLPRTQAPGDGTGAWPRGLGLGLQILRQQARVEGWGLTFATEAGRGLIIHLDVPLGRTA